MLTLYLICTLITFVLCMALSFMVFERKHYFIFNDTRFWRTVIIFMMFSPVTTVILAIAMIIYSGSWIIDEVMKK